MILKKDCQIVARVREQLHAEATRLAYRVAAGDFSRQPSLTLPRVATLILRGHKVSQQNAVNKFWRELGEPARTLTGAAYCQARQKLKPELFVHLNAGVVAEFSALSQADGTWRSWHGHRLLGADGSKLNLPDSAALRAAYSVVTNQHGAAGEVVQGLAVVLYDLLNDLGYAARLGPLAHEPDVLMQQLGAATQAGDVLVLDRNFADYALLAWGVQQQRYPRAEFYQVYGWRWQQETYYDRLKNIFECERFSGLSPHAIAQDFYGVIFLATLESTLAQSAQAALTARSRQRGSQAHPQV